MNAVGRDDLPRTSEGCTLRRSGGRSSLICRARVWRLDTRHRHHRLHQIARRAANAGEIATQRLKRHASLASPQYLSLFQHHQLSPDRNASSRERELVVENAAVTCRACRASGCNPMHVNTRNSCEDFSGNNLYRFELKASFHLGNVSRVHPRLCHRTISTRRRSETT